MYPHDLDVHPLTSWPGPLTPDHKRRRSSFSAAYRTTVNELRRELDAISGRNPVIEVAIPSEQFRIDGRPRATARAEHPGVVLSIPSSAVGPLRYATDLFTTWQDNLRAIVLGMEALRKVDRYGITRRGEQYRGFRALPPGLGGGEDREQMTLDAALRLIEGYGGRGAAIRATHPDHAPDKRPEWDQVEEALRVIKAG